VAFSLQFHESLLKSSENIYAALGGGWSRWQPLNVAVAKPYWQEASRRVSWQVATAMAAYSSVWMVMALVFQLGVAMAERFSFQWRWILNVIFIFLLCDGPCLSAGGGNGRAFQFSMGMDSKYVIFIFVLWYSAFFK
jgi:hypothetical protein